MKINFKITGFLTIAFAAFSCFYSPEICASRLEPQESRLDYRETLGTYIEQQYQAYKKSCADIVEADFRRGELIQRIFKKFPNKENEQNIITYIYKIDEFLGGNAYLYDFKILTMLCRQQVFDYSNDSDGQHIILRITYDNLYPDLELFLKSFIDPNQDFYSEKIEYLKKKLSKFSSKIDEVRNESFRLERKRYIEKNRCMLLDSACKAPLREQVYQRLYSLYEQRFNDYSEKLVRSQKRRESLVDETKKSISCPNLSASQHEDIALLRKSIIQETDVSLSLYTKMENARKIKENTKRILDIYSDQRKSMDDIITKVQEGEIASMEQLLKSFCFFKKDAETLVKLTQIDSDLQRKA